MQICLSDSIRKLQTPDTLRALGLVASPPTPQPHAPPPTRSPRMTKTEAKYLAEVLRPQEAAGAVSGIVFQPVTLRLANGHRYTPDFGFLAAGRAHFTEVKGSYRLHSYQRARLAFDQARIEWPTFVWIWAELQPNGTWRTVNA